MRSGVCGSYGPCLLIVQKRREAQRTRGGNDDNDPTRTDRHRGAYILWEGVITKQGTPGSRGGKHREDKRTGETN